MSRASFAIGVAAVLVAAGALFLLRPVAAPEVGGPPTPSLSASPTLAPSATAAPAQLPSAIHARWMSGQRDIMEGDAGTTMLLGDASIALSPAHSGGSIVLNSGASATAADRFRLETGPTDAHCASGDAGTYRWTLSPSGRTLTVTTDGDDCQARADAVSGEWWLMGCKNPENNCLGELSAGHYASQFINPRIESAAAWVPSYGEFEFTVPDGWANASDFPESYELMPSDSFASIPDSPAIHDIIFASNPSPLSKDAACASNPPPGVGASVEELVSWVATIDGLVATEPTPMTIGGYPGQWLDLRADPAADAICRENGMPLVEYMTSQPGGILGEQRHRLILLDLGSDDVMSIAITSEDPDSFDAFVAQAMPIVQSVEFRAAP